MRRAEDAYNPVNATTPCVHATFPFCFWTKSPCSLRTVVHVGQDSMRVCGLSGLALWAACVAAGCGGSIGGDACGPGTVSEGQLCVPAPSDANGADQSAAMEASPTEAAVDGDVPEATPMYDSASDASAWDAAAPDVTNTDAMPADVGTVDSTVVDVGPPDGGQRDSNADAVPLDAAADAVTTDAAADGYTIGPAPSCGGDGGVPAAVLVPLEGGLREVVIGPCNEHVYVSNGSYNRIEDYSVSSAATATPIAVGSTPSGFDITPDGRRLYVANTGGTNVSVVDLEARQELRKVTFTSNFSGDKPLSLAIAANGKALFSTTFGGSGFGGRMMSLDLATEAITQRTDFYYNGTTTEATVLKASADRSVIGIVAGDISSAPVFTYTAATNSFTSEHDLNGFISRVAVSADGSTLLVDGTYVLDSSANLLGTINGAQTPFAAFGPSAAVAYRASASGVDILDTAHFLVQGSISLTADTMQGNGGAGSISSAVGNMAVSSDGKWMAVITDHGITIVDVP